MKTNFCSSSAVLCGLFLTLPLTDAGADTYDYNPPGVKGITLSTGLGGKASVGDKIHVTCNIGYVGTKKIDNNGTGPDAYLDANGNTLPYLIYADKIKIGESKLASIVPATKTLTVGADWVVLPAYAGHQMMFKCVVDPLGKVHNSSQAAILTVLGSKKPPLQVPGPPQNMKPISNLQKVLPPKPDLVVAGVSISIASDCSNPMKILTAKISIHNNGGALPASKGVIHFNEFGGAHLASEKVYLPSFAAGQTKTVTLTGGTQPTFINALQLPHKIDLYFTAIKAFGEEPPFTQPKPPYSFAVNFPAGYCSPTQSRGAAPPSPGGSRSGSNRSAPAPAIQRLMLPGNSREMSR